MTYNPYIFQRRLKTPTPGVAALKPKEAIKYGGYVTDLLPLFRAPKTLNRSVTTTPSILIAPPHEWPYVILNPSLIAGLTSSYTIYSGTVDAAGNTQANPLGVANYLKMHFHLDITAITGTWDIYAQTKDPVSGKWTDSQCIFSGLTSIGTKYATVGEYGIVTDFAVRWDPVVAGSMTFSLSATVKEGMGGSSAGLARTIYIGGNDVTVDSGLEIKEGESKLIMLGPDITLYGVAKTTIPVKVFTL
ncbi:MAG: hypothetical protein K6T73_01175 [Candidatus Bathyarchaeota archaeon]|nr:hypothetical protein [Candidatus Bathyarchaeota archaeon]